MVTFISYKQEFSSLLQQIVTCEERHVKWLNALSYLENCGARKIAACEHPTKVKTEMLKHAAEEFRHAFYLKQQINKITLHPPRDYTIATLLGGMATFHYLHSLELKICRYLKEAQRICGSQLKEFSYLLVTYSIEARATELYPIYQQILKENSSTISVKSIVLEEDQHLAEIETELALLPNGKVYLADASAIESRHCKTWLEDLM